MSVVWRRIYPWRADSHDEEATIGIQVRGIFNELQLQDLRKKTLRGQIGQKERGFSVGERTFGYKSVPVGVMRMDKKGRPRPDGYRMVIESREAAVVKRIFEEFAGGHSQSRIVRRLNAEAVPGRFRSNKASPLSRNDPLVLFKNDPHSKQDSELNVGHDGWPRGWVLD